MKSATTFKNLPNLSDSLFITPLFEPSEGDDIRNQFYRDVILHTLKKILPIEFFEYMDGEEIARSYQQAILKKVIPLITWSATENFPGTLSFFALSKYRPNSFKFFFEMISRWLVPGRAFNVVLVYSTDFRLTQLSDEVYTICEVMINVLDFAEFEEIQRNFPVIATEIALGLQSEYYSHRILEIKGLTADDKTAVIQAFIAYLVKRFPNHYDTDIFNEMQHVLVSCRDDFKAARKARHLSRIISVQYLFRKGLRESLKKNSHRRHVHLKIFNTQIRTKAGHKKVLSFLVGINFIREQENFGERNLIKAIQHFIPSAQTVEGSFLIHKLNSENICLAYIEVEKKDGGSFSFAEIRKLRRELPSNLKNRIEHRLHSVFMPRNEEEVMRNILTLTNQIKYIRDIPQVSITFDEQAHSHLYFTVILARILKPDSLSIADLFKKNHCVAEYVHDRTKLMGYVRKKYAKEATVFRLKLSKDGFLRSDHSIDLYKARQMIVSELFKAVGEIRDFNGGMISKQHELLSNIRRLLSECDIKEYDELLLENFFYSLAPVVVRALVDPRAFKILFTMLLEGLKEYKSENYYLKFASEFHYQFALIIIEDSILLTQIRRAVQDIHIPPTELASAYVKTHGYVYLGYICCAHDPHKKEQFQQVISHVMKTSGS